MPYIAVKTGEALSEARKDALTRELGRLISIIPGKTEPDLIVDLACGADMYMGGRRVPCAYIDLRVYSKAEEGAKERFTSEVFTLISRELGIKKENLYMTVSEFDRWGYDGEYH
jgi:phenylpyruvate tautomerase PptA (4-oxalocrotonate tautomerase family)